VSTGDEIIDLVGPALDEALLAAAALVVEEAKRNIPVGDPEEDPDAHIRLADSSDISLKRNPFGNLVEISFNTPYAAKQHEDLRLKHPRGGGPKYLERALTTVMPQLANIVAARVDAETATGRLSDPRRRHR
jgi:hypothetical protein